MSVSFDKPIAADTLAKLREAFGEPVAQDGQNFLFERMLEVEQSVMSDIARSANQPATVELHNEGEVKVMSDGTRYQVTSGGWLRLAD